MTATMGLHARHLSKTFGGHRALDDVELRIGKGEVHGLLGQNGCGKSTLIKILAGYHQPDPGAELNINGRDIPLPLPAGRSQAMGISVVHQHLGLIPTLSVVENLELGRLSASNELAISWREKRRNAEAVFARYGLDISPQATIGSLSAVERALVAIVRAIEDLNHAVPVGTGVLILDEPTPFLPRADVERLFGLVRQITATGASVLFVSHDIDEVREITDRATILRDGRAVGALDTKAATRAEIIELIVGRKLVESTHASSSQADSRPVVEVKGLAGRRSSPSRSTSGPGKSSVSPGSWDRASKRSSTCSMAPRRARRETCGSTGRTSASTSRRRPRHQERHRADPGRSQPEGGHRRPAHRRQRDHAGAAQPAQSLGHQPQFDPQVRPRAGARIRRVAEPPELPLSALSGGNAQKVVLAKWLQTDPRLILLDEPTQGVDVGARELVFDAIRKSSRRGAATIVASSDYEQLAMLCDRVLVFSGGRVTRELAGTEITKDSIARSCLEGAVRSGELQ